MEQRAVPMLSYENVGAAVDWLSKAFGFRERECDLARRWLETPYVVDGVWVSVEDVDAHFAGAREAGATILGEPVDQPYGRLYRAADPEGHRWMFMRPSD